MIERRGTRRFEMRLPLVVRTAVANGPLEAASETEDVSSHGLYFTVEKNLAPGSAVEVLLTLPREITMSEPVRVRCQGRVVRVETKPQRESRTVGVAAVIDRYEFLRSEEKEQQLS